MILGRHGLRRAFLLMEQDVLVTLGHCLLALAGLIVYFRKRPTLGPEATQRQLVALGLLLLLLVPSTIWAVNTHGSALSLFAVFITWALTFVFLLKTDIWV